MNREIARRWTDRLRNRDIPQGAGCLGMPHGRRCCLGVLCDIAVEDDVIDPPRTESLWSFTYAGAHGSLPTQVTAWAGMLTREGIYDADCSLMADNDNGKTFLELADIIDAHWEDL
jgi:hypothetical protein